MITQYHRPKTLEEALQLLARPDVQTRALAGGTRLNQPSVEQFEVVDLQALGLAQVKAIGKAWEIGPTFTLQALLDYAEQAPADFTDALSKAIRHEATYNLRQVATIGGTLVSAGGRSPLTTVFLALDAALTLQPGEEIVTLGDLLPLRAERLASRLVTQVSIPTNIRLAYDYVARTPADQAIVSAAVALWPSGRTRVALGGFGAAPLLAFDGTDAQGIEVAAQSAYSHAGDQWASAAYRQEIAGVLATRCYLSLQENEA